MIVNYEGAKFYIDRKSTVENTIFKQFIKKHIGRFINKPYIPDEYLLTAREILSKNPHAIIVDIGANVGTTVLPLAKKFPSAQFYAIEPHPLPSSRFIKNCELNLIQNVTLLTAAIGDKARLAQIYTCPKNSGGHRLAGFKGRHDVQPSAVFGPISVPTYTLAEVFTNFGIEHCDLLKVDTEGFETKVLQSLGSLLSPEKINTIIAEVGSEGLACAGSSPSELLQLGLQHGYQCHFLQDKKCITVPGDLPELPPFHVKDFIFSKT